MDIKEALEVLEFAKDLAVEVKAILADGRVTIFDIPQLAKLWSPLKDALQNINLVPAEMKDLDAAEVQALMNESVAVAAAWAEVFVPAVKAAA